MNNQTLADTAVEKIKWDIILGNFAPGMKLNIEDLKKRYGIGLTPLREALNRLITLGFAEFEALKGFKVTATSKADVEDIYRTREIMEVEALQLALKKSDDEWESKVLASYYYLTKLEAADAFRLKPDLIEWMKRYDQFHFTIFAGCQSKWLIRLDTILFRQSERYRYIKMMKTTNYPALFADKVTKHKALIDAILARDAKQAIKIYKDLLRSTVQDIISDLDASA